MNRATRHVRVLLLAGMCALSILWASPGFASNASDLQAMVGKLVSDINKGDFKAVAGACAPHAAIVDGFPPYAWQTCADWMKGYEANNKSIQATLGTLSIGKPTYTEVRGDYAYSVYPVTFSDTQNGKLTSYKGSMAVTLQKMPSGWFFTGIASAWGTN
jgi:hypothetical protein